MLFHRRKPTRLLFFVKYGNYKGEFLLEMEYNNNECILLSLLNKKVHRLSIKEFDEGLKKKVLEAVEKLPRCVYNICFAEYQLIQREQQKQ